MSLYQPHVGRSLIARTESQLALRFTYRRFSARPVDRNLFTKKSFARNACHALGTAQVERTAQQVAYRLGESEKYCHRVRATIGCGSCSGGGSSSSSSSSPLLPSEHISNLGSLGRRHFSATTANGGTESVIPSLDLPPGSTADVLMQKCIEQAGEESMELYEPWLPVDLMQTLVMSLHDSFDLSWFSAIIASSVLLRIVLLPLAVQAIRGARERALARPEFDALNKLQQEAMSDRASPKAQKKQEEAMKQMQAFKEKYGSPLLFSLKGSFLVMFVQVPLYITAFRAMRGFALHPQTFPDFALETPLWLDSLAMPDPTYILPTFTIALMLTNLELYGSVDTGSEALTDKKHDSQSAQRYAPWIARFAVFMFLPFAGSMPSGLFVYMASNTVAVWAQNRLLKHPSVEMFLNLPQESNANAKRLQKISKKSLHLWQDELATAFSKNKGKRVMVNPRTSTDLENNKGFGEVNSAPFAITDNNVAAPLFEAKVPREKLHRNIRVEAKLSDAILSKYRIQRAA